MAKKDVWFRYTQVEGRFSAWPVNWKGWLSLILIVAIPVVAINLTQGWLTRTIGEAGLDIAIIASFVVVFSAIYALMRVKGEKVKR